MPNLLDEVKLYYLGGLDVTENPFVISKGRAFALPPVGGYLVMPRFNANDLIRRNEVVTSQGRFSVFTFDPRAAERAAKAPQAEVVATEREFTREELMAMLEDLDTQEENLKVEPIAAQPEKPTTSNRQNRTAAQKAKEKAEAEKAETKTEEQEPTADSVKEEAI